jgi:hypothetical protein
MGNLHEYKRGRSLFPAVSSITHATAVALGRTKLAAIGSATAKARTGYGLQAEVVPGA